MHIESILKASLDGFGMSYSQQQIDLVIAYLDILCQQNRKINLVGTKEREEIFIRHFLDSLSVLKYKKEIFNTPVNSFGPILDVGTGSGLPGILLSIFMPEKEFYLLDKKQKKIDFIEFVKHNLKLLNVRILKGLAEDLSQEAMFREKFSVVLARAVSKFNILCELAIPFCKIDGKIVLFKSKKVFKEIEDYHEAIAKLGGEIDSLLKVEVPGLDEFRVILIINKKRHTPTNFPRKIKKILKKPLS